MGHRIKNNLRYRSLYALLMLNRQTSASLRADFVKLK